MRIMYDTFGGILSLENDAGEIVQLSPDFLMSFFTMPKGTVVQFMGTSSLGVPEFRMYQPFMFDGNSKVPDYVPAQGKLPPEKVMKEVLGAGFELVKEILSDVHAETKTEVKNEPR